MTLICLLFGSGHGAIFFSKDDNQCACSGGQGIILRAILLAWRLAQVGSETSHGICQLDAELVQLQHVILTVLFTACG